MTVRRCKNCGQELIPSLPAADADENIIDNPKSSKGAEEYHEHEHDHEKGESSSGPSLLRKSLTCAKYAGCTIAAGAGVVTLAGFAPAGIAAGSMAAAWQSAIGNVAAGSTFAMLNSAGASGMVSMFGYGGAGAAATAYAADKAIPKKDDCHDDDPSQNKNKCHCSQK